MTTAFLSGSQNANKFSDSNVGEAILAEVWHSNAEFTRSLYPSKRSNHVVHLIPGFGSRTIIADAIRHKKQIQKTRTKNGNIETCFENPAGALDKWNEVLLKLMSADRFASHRAFSGIKYYQETDGYQRVFLYNDLGKLTSGSSETYDGCLVIAVLPPDDRYENYVDTVKCDKTPSNEGLLGLIGSPAIVIDGSVTSRIYALNSPQIKLEFGMLSHKSDLSVGSLLYVNGLPLTVKGTKAATVATYTAILQSVSEISDALSRMEVFVENRVPKGDAFIIQAQLIVASLPDEVQIGVRVIRNFKFQKESRSKIFLTPSFTSSLKTTLHFTKFNTKLFESVADSKQTYVAFRFAVVNANPNFDISAVLDDNKIEGSDSVVTERIQWQNVQFPDTIPCSNLSASE